MRIRYFNKVRKNLFYKNVLVDRQGELVQALVEKISYYSEETVPYPLSLTKDVLEVVTKDYDCVDTNL